MAPPPVILDCDPGHDDAVAMIVAAWHTELLGVTTVAGNAPLAKTTRNAIIVRDLLGIDVPVHSGAALPLVVAPVSADYVHGESGMDGADLPEPSGGPASTDAVGFIVETCRRREGVWLVPTGPLTNIALALRAAPDLAGRIAGISLMGGGLFGNRTATAEFNIWADPHAAAIVCDYGGPLVMTGLHLTHRFQATPDRVAAVRALPGLLAAVLADLFDFFSGTYVARHHHIAGAPVHDPCAVMALTHPDLFTGQRAHVAIETEGRLTRGMVVVDQRDLREVPAPNCDLLMDIDVDRGFDVITEAIRHFDHCTAMTDLILGPVLRHVTERTATIWMETDAACEVRCCDTTTRTFHVRGHHYALVIVDGLEPGSTTEYEVHLDGERRWPPEDSDLPPSSIRTLSSGGVERETPLRILFGSCRTAAPHEPPWSLELATDARGRGVDVLYAHARAMVERPIEEWADLVIFLGDQVYADDSSPEARKRIAARRKERPAHERLPPELVDDFEEYTWLYHESWRPKWERWLLSVVPSVMIFDDHEIIDDWNISDTWVADIHREEWWHDHIVGGLATYWLYQHLGNLDPEQIREEGMLADLLAADDGFDLLSRWAEEADRATPGHRRYRFSFARDIGSTKLVMVDSRMARILAPGKRAMVDDDEWAWVQHECREDVDHLIIGTSLPAFACGAVHDTQEWNEAVIDGAWGRWPRALPQRVGEKLRRWIDMEDWSAFGRSFHALVDLIAEIGSVDRQTAPASITLLSGDIHFSYHSELHFPAARRVGARCHQVVNSPIRNALTGAEHLMMRVAISRPAAPIGRVLRRLAGRPRTDIRWGMDHGPVWANCIAELRITGRHVQVKMEQSSPADDKGTPQLDVVFVVDLA